LSPDFTTLEAAAMSHRAIFAAILLLVLPSLSGAQVTFTTTTSDDAFLATGSPGNPAGSDLTGSNFGAAGVLAISPPSAVKGEFQSVLKFGLGGAATLFNATYGTNGWAITAISLELTSNFGTNGVQPDNPILNVVSGGNFVIEWLSNNDWVEGTGTPKLPTSDGVTYDSLPELLSTNHEILCTNNYSPPGNNVPVIYALPLNTNLVSAAENGGDVSLLFYAADNQIGYIFNSHNFGGGNQPFIHVTASPLLRITSGYFTNGVFHLSGIGGDNIQYHVQANTNLATTNWQSIGTVTADGSGKINFDDVNAANYTQGFYRLSE
jgi:hypothetical protein